MFLADDAQEIHLIKLENDDVTCNGKNVLAFDAGIDWDITKPGGAPDDGGRPLQHGAAGHRSGRDHLRRPASALHTGDAATYADP